MSALTLLFKIVLEVLARSIKQEKEKKCIQIGKEKYLYLQMTQLFIQKVLRNPPKIIIINEFIKVSGRINMQISTVSLYTCNEKSKNIIMKTTPFTAISKRIKYFEINLTREVQDVFYKNYKILIEEIREDLNKWKGIPCTFNILGWQSPPNLTIVWTQSLSKFQLITLQN